MHNKTAAGTFSPLLAIGIAAVVGGCSTQPDAQLPQFNSGPVVEAVYARDNAAAVFGIGSLPDVQVWANPADPHYPNQVGETGAQNAANVSPFPASYGAIVVEFNIPLDGSKLGAQNDLGSYCSIGGDATNSPITVLDATTGSTKPLSGSVCYDPTSPLFRYPSLTYVVGQSVAADSSVNPFTCQGFGAEGWSPDGAHFDGGVAFIPTHKYTVKFNTSVVVNDNGQAVTTPSGDAAWTDGAFTFSASGFEIMAVGYQDQNTGYFSFLSKPYKGFLKDLPEAGAAGFQQPSDDTPFFVITSYPYNFDSNCLPAPASGTDTVTAVRTADHSSFGAIIYDDFCVGGLYSYDPRIMNFMPALATPGLDGPANGGSGTWEPGQGYTINIPATIADIFAQGVTLGTAATYTFTASPGDPAPVAIAPKNGSVANAPYGADGPNGIAYYLDGQTPFASSSISQVVVNFNVPVDPTLATTTNFTVSGPDGTAVAGAVHVVTDSNNQALAFQPTKALEPGTVYKVDVNNLKVDPAVPTFNNAAIPELKTVFTTATMRTASLVRFCVHYPNKNECGSSAGTTVSMDRASNQPLQALFAVKDMRLQFTRPAVNVTPTTVVIQEINADGSAGAVIDSSKVTIAAGSSALRDYAYVDQSYPVKCGQKYEVISQTAITDNETPANTLTAEGCKTAGGCVDIRSFTTQAFQPEPLDSSGDTILYTPTDGTHADSLTVSFNASLDSATVNPLLASGSLISLADASGAAVAITCPALADDKQTDIVCTTNSPLALNKTYVATMLVQSTAPLKIATAPVLYALNSHTPSATLVGDQTTCQYFGTTQVAFTTPCPATTPRHPASRQVSKTVAQR